MFQGASVSANVLSLSQDPNQDPCDLQPILQRGKRAVPYLLFGRVGELVLPPPVVALLDARVIPQGLDGTDVPVLKRRHLFHIHFPDQERIGL